MALVLRPDGSSMAFAYTCITDAHRELGGYFDSIPGQIEAGYLVLVHDEGRILVPPLPRNTMAEILTGYPEIYGNACVVSFQEANEEDLLYRIVPTVREAFDRRLLTLTQKEKP